MKKIKKNPHRKILKVARGICLLPVEEKYIAHSLNVTYEVKGEARSRLRMFLLLLRFHKSQIVIQFLTTTVYRDASRPLCAVVRNTDWRLYMHWAQISEATTFFFLQNELIGRIINSFSSFWDISKIQRKKKLFNARLQSHILVVT